MGVMAPPVGTPGRTPGVYSNTNYLLLGQLLEKLTGTTAEKYITQNVIERAELRDTELVADRMSTGPTQIYESWFGMIDPPRDYSVYGMSWVGPAAALILTVADLNRYGRQHRRCLAGKAMTTLAAADQSEPTLPDRLVTAGPFPDANLGVSDQIHPSVGQTPFWGRPAGGGTCVR